MGRYILYYFLSVTLFSLLIRADTCDDFDPIVLTLGTCSLSSGTAGINNIGLLIHTGNPSPEYPSDSNRQCVNLAFSFQNTILMSPSVCSRENLSSNKLGTWTEETCRTIKGGFYSPPNSTTYSAASLEDLVDDVYYKDNVNAQIRNPFRDELAVQEVTLSDFPMGLIDSGRRHNTGFIGIGSNSTFLNNLKCGSTSKSGDVIEPRRIGCRCLGLDMGSSDFNRSRDGSIILGGYDKKAVTGQFAVVPISTVSPKDPTRTCPLKVKINKLDLILPAEDSSSNEKVVILSTLGTAMTACIEPYDTLFRFPDQIVQAIKRETNHDSNLPRKDANLITPEPGLLYDTAKNPFRGSLRFEIVGWDGTPLPSITITNRDLAGPLSGFKDPDTTHQENLTEVKIFDTVSVVDEILQDTAVLGKVWLSQVYLAVNYDKGVFGVAEISDGAGGQIMPKRLPEELDSCDNECGNGGGGGGKLSGAEKGAIVGGIVGFFVLSAVIALLVWWFKFRRGRRNGEQGPDGRDSKEPDGNGPSPPMGYAITPRLTDLGNGNEDAPHREHPPYGYEPAPSRLSQTHSSTHSSHPPFAIPTNPTNSPHIPPTLIPTPERYPPEPSQPTFLNPPQPSHQSYSPSRQSNISSYGLFAASDPLSRQDSTTGTLSSEGSLLRHQAQRNGEFYGYEGVKGSRMEEWEGPGAGAGGEEFGRVRIGYDPRVV